MSLDTFVSGRYSSTFNSSDCGITQQGYTLQQDSAAELINQTDAYGDSVIDWVYRGGNVFLQFESKAYKAGSVAPFWPYYTLGKLSGSANPIGRLASSIAASMVLTSTANTPAASAPATLTGTYALLAPNSPANLLFDSRVRNVPVRLQFLPYASGSDTIWFTTS